MYRIDDKARIAKREVWFQRNDWDGMLQCHDYPPSGQQKSRVFGPYTVAIDVPDEVRDYMAQNELPAHVEKASPTIKARRSSADSK